MNSMFGRQAIYFTNRGIFSDSILFFFISLHGKTLHGGMGVRRFKMCFQQKMYYFCCVERLGYLVTVSMPQNRRKRQGNLHTVVLNSSSTELLRPQEQVAILGDHLAEWVISETVKRLGACCCRGLGCHPNSALSPWAKGNLTYILLDFFMSVSLCGICPCSCGCVPMGMEVGGASHHLSSVYVYTLHI